jgi:hypothetical protein
MNFDELRPSLDDVLPPHLDREEFGAFGRELNALADEGRFAELVSAIDDILRGDESQREMLRAAIRFGARFSDALGVYTSTLLLRAGRKETDDDPGAQLRRRIRRIHGALSIQGERAAGRPRVRV